MKARTSRNIGSSAAGGASRGIGRRSFVALTATLPALGLASRTHAGDDRKKRQAVIRRFYEPLSGTASTDVYAEVLTDDWVGTPLAFPEQKPGPEDYAGAIAHVRELLPDMSLEIEQIIGEEDLFAVRSRLRATHTTDEFGVPATGQPFDIMTMDMHRFDGDRIDETWHVEDWLGMLEQIGALPDR